MKNFPAQNSPKGWQDIEAENPVINPLGPISPKNAKIFSSGFKLVGSRYKFLVSYHKKVEKSVSN